MLTRSDIDRVVSAALAEDAPWGDATAEAFVPASARARAELVAREPGTFSGGAVFAAAFALTDTAISVALHRADGEAFTAGVWFGKRAGHSPAVTAAAAGRGRQGIVVVSPVAGHDGASKSCAVVSPLECGMPYGACGRVT